MLIKKLLLQKMLTQNRQSFGHKMFISSKHIYASNQETYVTKAVNLAVLRREMVSKPQGGQSFGHKMVILLQPYLYV